MARIPIDWLHSTLKTLPQPFSTLLVYFWGVILYSWSYSLCFQHIQMSPMEEQQKQTKGNIHSVIRRITNTIDLEVA